jgi:hypothetical protein
MMKRLVLVDLAGGLGNQIFLFQAANYVASINKNLILINRSNIDKYHSKGKSTIGDFIFPRTVKFFEISVLFNKFYVFLRGFLRKYNNFNQSIFFVLDESYNLHTREEVYRLILEKNPLLTIVCGFWQNLEYWDDSFQFELKSHGEKFIELTNEMKTNQPVVFHYRLGRINGKWEHGWGALNPIFLVNALSELSKTDAISKVVWIFSNDLQEAKALTASLDYSPYKLVFIDDFELSPAELLILFSLSNTLICSNSTFSILAAKIGKISSVFVPAELSKNGHRTFALPDDWTRIKSTWLA